MSTGDSMYITPFVPHTFATRNNSNSNGVILALTYGGKLTGEFQQELASMSNLGQEFALDFSSTETASSSLLRYNREISTLTLEELSKRTNISLDDLTSFESDSNKPSIKELEKIAKSLSVNIRDLLPNDVIEDKVILKMHENCRSWYYPEVKKHYKFFELASTTTLPFSKSLEVEILNSNDSELDICSGLHQYIYNIGKNQITLNWEINGKKNQKVIYPNDSLYMKPFVKHNFRGSGKLLILRVGGKIPGDSQRELSIVGKENAERAISETTLWFDKKGKN
jgi:methylphosphonate synthase